MSKKICNYIIYPVLVITGLFLVYELCAQNAFLKERNLDYKDTIENQFRTIDSLQLEIDTLVIENEVWDEIQMSTNDLLSAIIMVESRNNDSAHAVGEDAVGVLQIRKVMVDDVNRILKRKNLDKIYTYEDRWDRNKSIEMFHIFVDYYNLETAEEVARGWNGGPRGINNPATEHYWLRVEDYLSS